MSLNNIWKQWILLNVFGCLLFNSDFIYREWSFIRLTTTALNQVHVPRAMDIIERNNKLIKTYKYNFRCRAYYIILMSSQKSCKKLRETILSELIKSTIGSAAAHHRDKFCNYTQFNPVLVRFLKLWNWFIYQSGQEKDKINQSNFWYIFFETFPTTE